MEEERVKRLSEGWGGGEVGGRVGRWGGWRKDGEVERLEEGWGGGEVGWEG